MRKLTELAISRPLLITVIFTVLVLFGVISYTNLNYNLLPKFDAPVVSVITTYRGASADEIENTVTKEIEEAISTLEGIDKITSSSMEGASMVIVQLLNGIDVDKAQNDAQRKVNQIMALLPQDVDDPIVNKFSSDDIPVLRMGVTANIDDKSLYDIIDLQVKPLLASLPGVGEVSMIGGNERQLTVNINREKLESYGLSIETVANIINASSISTPAGNVESNKNEYAIKFDSKIEHPNQLRNIPLIKLPTGGTIYLKDIAEVVDGQKEITTINHINGLPSIGLQILKQSDANAVEVVKLAKNRLADISEQFKDINIQFEIASDQSEYTLDSANAVITDLTLAIIIVSLVMLFFLHSFRSSLFVLIALPASMIPTFIAMYLFGFSLNLMTLMALSLVVGVLVDDSIVILENIMRHLEMGKNKRQATIDGRSEIGFTALSITLVDVVVFFPMAMVSGMIGNILREFALVIVVSVLMSLFVAFTLTPLLASRWGKLPELNPNKFWGRLFLSFENAISAMRDVYTQILTWALNKKRYVFGFVLLLFVGTYLLLTKGFIGTSFMSSGDQGEFVLKIELEPNASVYQTNLVSMEAEKILLAQPEVENVFSNIGFSGSGIATVSNSNKAELNVKLIDKKKRTISSEDFGEKMREEIAKIPGAKITVTEMDLTGNAEQAPVSIIIKGNDREKNKEFASQVKEIVNNTPGTAYVEYSTEDPKPQIEVRLDREKMVSYGINAVEVGTAIGSTFRGNDFSKYKHEGNEYDIMIKSDQFNKTNINDVRNLTFVTDQGLPFRLEQFADVQEVLGESVLQRKDRLPSISVNASVIGRSVGTVGQEIIDKVNQLTPPDGVTWEAGGQLEMQDDAFSSLLAALGIGFLLVYLIMVALYENAVYPFVVLFALPLATIGAFLALALSLNELTIFAMIGLIMLMGLVAKNGILLVDFTNQRKAEGASLTEALIDAGRERFRPIMMTTVAMIFGMLPIAMASGSGAEVKNGMAWVIIGGLTSSLLLTLVVVPCVYYIVDSILNRFRSKRRKRLIQKVIERRAISN
ncbi:MAG TPA: efflux RND transporter permease subunit [Chitinophagaceae bacterium]|nr:efflux RND transporter permease subunit [Chitinophagaceae bacterium]